MRKIIRSKEVKRQEGKEVKPLNKTENSKMEKKQMTLETVYSKMYRRLSYLTDRDTTTKLLDFQDALNEAMSKAIASGVKPDNPNHYLRRAVKNEMIGHKNEILLENFGDTLNDITEEIEQAEISNPQDEIITVMEAIAKVLTDREKQIFNSYISGSTIRELEVEFTTPRNTIHLEVKKIYDKIEALKISYFYDSKYVRLQSHKKRERVKWSSEAKVWDNKAEKYITWEEVIPSREVKRNFLCLDQYREVKKYEVDREVKRIAIRKEVKIKREDNMKWFYKNEYYWKSSQYENTSLPSYETNQEIMYLYKNMKQYRDYIKSISSVVNESRYEIHFNHGKYISTDRKYLNK